MAFMNAPMMTDRSLATAIDRYARMEMRIGDLMPPTFAEGCATCDCPCCRPECGDEILASWWLKTVSEHVHGRWWQAPGRDRYPCRALGEAGCILRAGRPVICRSYHCEALAERCGDLWELLRFACLSELTGWVGQLSSRVRLDAIEVGDAPTYLETIHERLDAADRVLSLCERLADEAQSETIRHRAALEVICENPTLLRPIVCRRVLYLLGEATP